MALNDQMAAEISFFLGFIDGKQLKFGAGLLYFGFRARHQGECDTIVIQRDFITSHSFLFGGGIWQNQHWIAFQIREVRCAHQHAAQFCLAANEIEQAEFFALSVFLKQDFARVKAVEILAVPDRRGRCVRLAELFYTSRQNYR